MGLSETAGLPKYLNGNGARLFLLKLIIERRVVAKSQQGLLIVRKR